MQYFKIFYINLNVNLSTGKNFVKILQNPSLFMKQKKYVCLENVLQISNNHWTMRKITEKLAIVSSDKLLQHFANP